MNAATKQGFIDTIAAKIEENEMIISQMEENIAEGWMIEEAQEIIAEMVKENKLIKDEAAKLGIFLV